MVNPTAIKLDSLSRKLLIIRNVLQGVGIAVMVFAISAAFALNTWGFDAFDPFFLLVLIAVGIVILLSSIGFAVAVNYRIKAARLTAGLLNPAPRQTAEGFRASERAASEGVPQP